MLITVGTTNMTTLGQPNSIIQWKPLNGIAMGQRQIDSNKRLIPISELGS
jgi:hypothetical protein